MKKIQIISLLIVFIIIFSCFFTSCKTKAKETDVLASDNFTINRGMAVYLFYENTTNWLSQYSESDVLNMGFVYGKAMKEQIYEGSQTWFDVFYEYNTKMMKNLLMLCEHSYSQGVVLDDSDELKLNQRVTAFNGKILFSGAPSVEAYVKDMYKGYTTEDDIREVLKLQLIAEKNSDNLYNTVKSQVTEEQIQQAIASQGEEKNTALSKNIAYFILDYENYLENEAQPLANTIINQLKSMADLNVSKFQEVAGEYSHYEFMNDRDVCPGDLYREVDGWLYGQAVLFDITSFKTESGIQIVYYYGDGEQIYLAKARSDAYDKQYAIWHSKTMENMKFRINDSFYDEFNP